MSAITPAGPATFPGLTTRTAYPGLWSVVGVARLPTDPLFYSDVTLENIIVGSRYRLARSDGTELTKGVADSSPLVISGIPCYTNPQLVRCDVRYSSAATKYIPLTVYAYQNRLGASFYIAQSVDEVAT